MCTGRHGIKHVYHPTVRSAGGSSQLKRPVMRVRVTGPSEGSRVESQLVNSGRQPSWCGSRYTMPQGPGSST